MPKYKRISLILINNQMPISHGIKVSKIITKKHKIYLFVCCPVQ